jgi:hypothetical protein
MRGHCDGDRRCLAALLATAFESEADGCCVSSLGTPICAKTPNVASDWLVTH